MDTKWIYSTVSTPHGLIFEWTMAIQFCLEYGIEWRAITPNDPTLAVLITYIIRYK